MAVGLSTAAPNVSKQKRPQCHRMPRPHRRGQLAGCSPAELENDVQAARATHHEKCNGRSSWLRGPGAFGQEHDPIGRSYVRLDGARQSARKRCARPPPTSDTTAVQREEFFRGRLCNAVQCFKHPVILKRVRNTHSVSTRTSSLHETPPVQTHFSTHLRTSNLYEISSCKHIARDTP